jgi:membrane protease YdiL (CAAX protease family)
MSLRGAALPRPSRGASLSATTLLCIGLAAAMVLRLSLAGTARTASPLAGVAFAAGLLALAAVASWNGTVRASLRTVSLRRAGRDAVIGLAGAAVLLVVPVALHLEAGPLRFGSPAAAFPLWATVVTLVAVAEEALLRGALMSALLRCTAPEVAVALAALAFAAIHVPLYGWVAVPLDLAVGVWLGGLRLLTGGAAAPAVAHSAADLATWWLR